MQASPVIFGFLLFVNPYAYPGPYPGPYQDVEIKTIPVARNVYMLQGSGGNMGLTIGKDGAFLVDDQFAPLSRKIQAAIAKVSKKPVRFLVNTHWHGDHTGGNENFGKSGAIIVAHENVRKRMSVEQFMKVFDRRVPAAPKLALPVITFPVSMTFYWNDDEIVVTHVAHAHTDGDSIIHYKRANVIHAGDIYFNGLYPFIDTGSGGSIAGVIAAVNKILAMGDDETKIIPGHGTLSNKKELGSYRNMLVKVQANIGALINGGKSKKEVQDARPTKEFDAVWGNGFMRPDRFTGIVYESMTSSQESRPNAKPAWQRFRLDNGIAVSVLQIKDAPRQSSFSFLPMGLLNDVRDRAQFSHLIEHMIIRSTDPERLGVDGIMINGETMGSTVRLESIAVPDKWQEALRRHVRWLTVKTIDGKGIAKEKENIAAEIENTQHRGYTHKWALAAWNQVIRHGKQHAAVMGDVAAADPDQIVELLPRALRLRKVQIYCVGPISAEQIEKLLRAAFPAVVEQEGEKEGKDKQGLPVKKSTLATWDLQCAQLMLWFPMAGKKADEYLAAEVMAMNINMNLQAAGKLRKLGVLALASVERLPIEAGRERVSVLLSASCKTGQDPSVVEKLLLKAVSGLTRTSLAFTLLQVKNQSKALPDFATLREQVSGRMAAFLEANVALQVAYRELNSGLSSKEYSRSIGLLDKERLMVVHVSRMKPELAYSLFLTPQPKKR